MTDMLLQVGLSNAALSLAIAIVAVIVGATSRRPHIAYLLWLLVFVKLLTPPIATLPIVALPEWFGGTDAVAAGLTGHVAALGSELAVPWFMRLDAWKVFATCAWLFGSVVFVAWSLMRTYRFNALLRRDSGIAPREFKHMASEIADRLGLKRLPAIHTTSARVSPLVWWVGGRVRVVVPTALINQMDAEQIQWILAHELAHVRRRDYLVRWIEWLASVCFWWNPMVWWARRSLSAQEELCCDAMVVSSLRANPHAYAASLLQAVECLVQPDTRTPAVASGINSGGFLEKRFKMIVSDAPVRTNTRSLQAWVLLAALLVLPLGVGCQEGEALTDVDRPTEMETHFRVPEPGSPEYLTSLKIEAYKRHVARTIHEAVQAGELTKEEAHSKLTEFEDGLEMRIQEHEKHEAEHEAALARIKVAVDEGRLTLEQAEERLAGYKRHVEYRNIEDRLHRAVEAGELTRENAEAELVETHNSLFGPGHSENAKDKEVEQALKRFKMAVSAGEITPEEAKEKMAHLKRDDDG